MLRHITIQRHLCVLLVLILTGISSGQTEIFIPNNVIVPQSRSYGFSRCSDPVIRIVDVKANVEISPDSTAETTLIINLQNMSSTEQFAELVVPVPDSITERDMHVGQEAAPIIAQVLTRAQATLLLG